MRHGLTDICFDEGVTMNVLVVDVGGTTVKILATGQDEARRFPSGPTLTAEQMVVGVKNLAGDWKYDAVSIGYPNRSSKVDCLQTRVSSDVGGWAMTLKLRFSVQYRS